MSRICDISVLRVNVIIRSIYVVIVRQVLLLNNSPFLLILQYFLEVESLRERVTNLEFKLYSILIMAE